MKLFVIADIHGALDPFDRGRDIIRRCDAVVIAGDLCRRGKPADAMKVIKKVESINRTIIAVPGNWDPAPVMEMLEEKGYSVHASSKRMNDIAFFGCGGAPKSLLRTPTMFTEAQISAFLDEAHKGITGVPKKVLVTHVPPRGLMDRSMFRMHLGSSAVREFIDRNRPLCIVCGHVHEAAGVELYGNVNVINPGSFRMGKYCIVTIDDSITVHAGVM